MPRKKIKIKGQKGGTAVAYQQNGQMNPMIGAAIGAAVGGVMGAAAAVALSDRETREKIKKAAVNLRDQAVTRIDEMQHKAKNVEEMEKHKAEKALKKN